MPKVKSHCRFSKRILSPGYFNLKCFFKSDKPQPLRRVKHLVLLEARSGCRLLELIFKDLEIEVEIKPIVKISASPYKDTKDSLIQDLDENFKKIEITDSILIVPDGDSNGHQIAFKIIASLLQNFPFVNKPDFIKLLEMPRIILENGHDHYFFKTHEELMAHEVYPFLNNFNVHEYRSVPSIIPSLLKKIIQDERFTYFFKKAQASDLQLYQDHYNTLEQLELEPIVPIEMPSDKYLPHSIFISKYTQTYKASLQDRIPSMLSSLTPVGTKIIFNELTDPRKDQEIQMLSSSVRLNYGHTLSQASVCKTVSKLSKQGDKITPILSCENVFEEKDYGAARYFTTSLSNGYKSLLTPFSQLTRWLLPCNYNLKLSPDDYFLLLPAMLVLGFFYSNRSAEQILFRFDVVSIINVMLSVFQKKEIVEVLKPICDGYTGFYIMKITEFIQKAA